MPKVAAEIVSGGHDFKTSLMAGFEKSMNYEKLYYTGCIVRFFSRASKWMQIQMIMVKKEYRFRVWIPISCRW